MRVTLFGTRGSIPAPGPETTRYGGNTPAVEVRAKNGALLAFDAGTGIRRLGAQVSPATARTATAEADSRPALHDALIAVVGRAGKIDGRMFGNWLAKHSDRVVDIADEGGEPAFFAFEHTGDRSGVALWRLAERQK